MLQEGQHQETGTEWKQCNEKQQIKFVVGDYRRQSSVLQEPQYQVNHTVKRKIAQVTVLHKTHLLSYLSLGEGGGGGGWGRGVGGVQLWYIPNNKDHMQQFLSSLCLEPNTLA